MTVPRDREAGNEPASEPLVDHPTRHYAEGLAALLDAAGFPRMPARTLMALLTSPEGELTAEQISQALDVSPAAVSGAIRYLQSVHVIRVGSLPRTRRRIYGLAPHWYTITLTRRTLYAELSDAAEQRPPAIGPETAAGHRVQEMADFYRFLSQKFPEILHEWETLRAHRADGGS
ncbi:GbsR/MarR family transcriptional regulator [Ruania zhangjianzhongii]|uniref:GbsR/MarR family transcriptional regulator n=1 Tax=Ruania zhangjianzhongii TaxID=2603206 RepID=UPI0011C6FB4B|nr:MarR family transcriptional regulator [Ruania zhangjianzhongii]